MRAELPWNVVGVSAEAREAARAAARREGQSIGEWLERRIAEGLAPVAPSNVAPPKSAAADAAIMEAAANRLEERIANLEGMLAPLAAASQGWAETDAGVREQGQVLDHLVAQFVTVVQHLEALRQPDPTAPQQVQRLDGLAVQIAALTQDLAALRLEQRTGLARLEDRLIDLESPPAALGQTAFAPGPAAFEPVSLAPETEEPVQPPPPEPSQPEPVQPEASQPEPFQPVRVSPAAVPRSAIETARIPVEEPQAPTRPRPVAPVILIVAAVLVAGAGLLFSRHASWSDAKPAVTQAVAPPALPAASPPAPAEAAPAATAEAAPPDPQNRLRELAANGNAKAALVLASQYLRGDPPNQAEAVRWLEMAAKAGEPVAQYRLGDLYERGRGVAADPAHAASLYLSAAGHGNRAAMGRIAAAYAAGSGVRRDYGEAARWFAKAAQYGLSDPQFNLAVLYEQGKGVPQSLGEAYKWYAIAAAGGDAESRARLSVLAGQLSPEEKRTAKAAADAFRPQTPDPAANAAPSPASILK